MIARQFPAWMIILNHIYVEQKEISLTKISKNTLITYSYVDLEVNKMIKDNWLVKVKKGRTTYISLSEDGLKKAKQCYDFMQDIICVGLRSKDIELCVRRI
mgnify:CR=1 FL=1